MNHLRREMAPLSTEAWEQIEDEAKRTLQTYLAGRKIVDFSGPHGWDYSSVSLGRSRSLEGEDVKRRIRQVLPLMEFRVPFHLQRTELEDISRGAQDADLSPVVASARKLALEEDRVIFNGQEDSCVQGIMTASDHAPVALSEDYKEYPKSVVKALQVLREAGVAGPYALALGPRCYDGLTGTAGPGGYPVLQHVKRLIDGPVIWAPSISGAVLASMRGEDFQLVVGQDISIGYLHHDRDSVELYMEESMTFRLLGPEAAVPLVYPTS